MNLRRIIAIMRKEVIQIWRDPLSLLVIFAMPIVQLIIYGYGVNLDVKHIPLCVYDRDGTQASQDLLKHFQATDYFSIVHVADSYRDVINRLIRASCTVAVVVPTQFSEELHSKGRVAGAGSAGRQRQQHRQHWDGLCAEHCPGVLARYRG